MTTQDVYEALDELYVYIGRQVDVGYLHPDDIAAFAIDAFDEDLDPAVLRHHARRYTAELLAAHLAAQSSWPAVTDCDRLDAAFAALERAGIVCRPYFSCCSGCGAAAIWEEIGAAEAAGRRVEGYAFFAIEEAEQAAQGYGLALSYGARAPGPAATEAVGQQLVAALEAKGLDPLWDGEWTSRIHLPLEWLRRR